MRRLKDYRGTGEGIKIREPDKRILSLGGGQQSTALAVMAYLEEYDIPEPDKIIYADVGAEPGTKRYLESEVFPWLTARGANCEIMHTGNMLAEIKRAARENNFVCLPVWTTTASGEYFPLPQMCSYNVKIKAIHQAIRKEAGFEKRQHATGKLLVEIWLGISTDETGRRETPWEEWIINRYPLIEQGFSRSDCVDIFERVQLSRPERSSCYFCPMQRPASWGKLKRESPELFEEAVSLDEYIRTRGGVDDPVFLHAEGKPLKKCNT